MTALPDPGQLLAGRYRVVGTLGVGGMGAVLEAIDVQMDRAVAIKWIRPEALTATAELRLVEEARAMARVEHPNVAQVLDAGFDDAPFLAMERLHGEPLEARLARGTIPIDEALRVVAEACAGVAAIHAESIVHRDLKPANLFLVSRADQPVTVEVLDFGIARMFDDGERPRLTQTGVPLGTPRYMAPEQLDARTPTAAFDVYALGVILYELLAHRPPFDAPGLMALILEIKTGTPAPLRRWNPLVDDALEALVHRCLARDPSQRPTAGELGAALRAMIPRYHGADAPPGAHLANAATAAIVTGRAGATLEPPAPRSARRRGFGCALASALGLTLVIAGTAAGAWWLGHDEPLDASTDDAPTDSPAVGAAPAPMGIPLVDRASDGSLELTRSGNCAGVPLDDAGLIAFSTSFDRYVTVGNYPNGPLGTGFLVVTPGSVPLDEPCALAPIARTGCTVLLGTPGTSWGSAYEGLAPGTPHVSGHIVFHEWAPSEGRVHYSLQQVVLPGQHEGGCWIDGDVEIHRVRPVAPR